MFLRFSGKRTFHEKFGQTTRNCCKDRIISERDVSSSSENLIVTRDLRFVNVLDLEDHIGHIISQQQWKGDS